MPVDTSSLMVFALASAALIVVPGPTVTVIIANSLANGARAGLFNVLGTQLGLASMLLLFTAGFSVIVERLGSVFDVVRVVGAVYLVWLGIKLWRANGGTFDAGSGEKIRAARSDAWYVRQGVFVIWANPKILMLFGAFIPQFVNPANEVVPQVLTLGLVFMVIATFFDVIYALAAGRMGQWLSKQRARVAERCAAAFLIVGGVWLALSGGLTPTEAAAR